MWSIWYPHPMMSLVSELVDFNIQAWCLIHIYDLDLDMKCVLDILNELCYFFVFSVLLSLIYSVWSLTEGYYDVLFWTGQIMEREKKSEYDLYAMFNIDNVSKWNKQKRNKKVYYYVKYLKKIINYQVMLSPMLQLQINK